MTVLVGRSVWISGGLDDFGEAEVCELHIASEDSALVSSLTRPIWSDILATKVTAVRVDQDVLRLQITINDVQLVAIPV